MNVNVYKSGESVLLFFVHGKESQKGTHEIQFHMEREKSQEKNISDTKSRQNRDLIARVFFREK